MSENKLKLISISYEENGEEYSKTSTNLVRGETSRGFGHLTFLDRYEQICSLQDSSLATEPAIWLGVDNVGPSITGPNGQRNEDVSIRMHLTQEMVKELLPYLTEFANNGSYISEMKIDKEKN